MVYGSKKLGRQKRTVYSALFICMGIIILNLILLCRELLKEEDGDPPDPYVRLYLKPDKSKSGRRKTKEYKKTCSPTFDET